MNGIQKKCLNNAIIDRIIESCLFGVHVYVHKDSEPKKSD
jgi:hypothetical protein